MEAFHADHAANVHKASLFEEPLLGTLALHDLLLTEHPAHLTIWYNRTKHCLGAAGMGSGGSRGD
jgi:hypothetical protein